MNIKNRRVYSDEITEDFSLHEFECNDKGEVIINKDVIQFILMLQEFRDWYNRAMSPSSGFRTEAYNESEGGVSDSQHLLGIAADFHFPKDEEMSKQRENEFLDNIKNKWFEICDSYNVNGGVFYYNWGFHLDSRTNKPRSHRDFR